MADGVGQQVGDDAAHPLDVEAGRQRVVRVDRESDATVRRERLEGLRDGPYGAREIRVDERESRLAVIGLDLLEHVVDLLERTERRDPHVDDLRPDVWGRFRAQQLLGSGDDDLQRRSHVVRELAEQPLAVVVHAGEPLGQSGQLRILPRQAVLDALAIGDRPAFGDDERDAAVACPQRTDREVQSAWFATRDAHADVEAREIGLRQPTRPRP